MAHSLSFYLVAVFVFGGLLVLLTTYIRKAGLRAGVRTAGANLAASALPAAVIFLIWPQASIWWLLSCPIALAVYLFPLVTGVRERSVPLDTFVPEECLVTQASTKERGKLLTIAHLSDLHICNTEPLEGNVDPANTQAAANRALRWALDQADLVLITGDVTDRGSLNDHSQLLALLKAFSSEKERIFIVPGNHDLSICLTDLMPNDGNLLLEHDRQHRYFAGTVIGWFMDQWRTAAPSGSKTVLDVLADTIRYIEQYDATPPRVARPEEMLGGEGLRSAFGYAAEYGALSPPVIFPEPLRMLAGQQPEGSIWPSPRELLFIDLFRHLFPIVFFEDEHFVFIGLNSNAVDEITSLEIAGLNTRGAMANSIVTGGFGLLGKEQLQRLDRILERTGDRCKVILLHHHVGEPAVIRNLRADKRFHMKTLQLRDAANLHRILARHSSVLVFHGHQHVGYRAAKGNIVVVSAPSVAYGDKLGGPNCHIYQISSGPSQARASIRSVESTTITAGAPT